MEKEDMDGSEDTHITTGTVTAHYLEEEERKVMRKIDRVILPMVCPSSNRFTMTRCTSAKIGK